MTQLDEYPLGLLRCPDERTDLLGNHCWHGNDRMILGFMQTHMYSAEIQHIAACTTSAEAFRMLRVRHEKRSGLTQLQLIQRLMQITFDDDPEQFDANMATFRDLVYRIESIGQVDISKLGLLFILLNLKSSHPTVHDALAPALMDGSITVELMEHRMRYHFEMRGAQQGQQHLPGQQNLPGPSIALPALPQRTFMCPNCKRPGHTIEFCIAPGGKMEGLSMHDAINRQRIARESFRQRARPREEGSTSTSSAPLKLDDDGSIWIAGVRYRPENKISAAMANSEVPTPNPDLEEYSEWPGDGYTDTFLDTNAILIASIDSPDVTDVALFSHPADPPFFLDSGASSHISCIRSDFTSMKSLNEPRKISGVGNASVSAVGVGTVILLLPQTNAQLRLHNVLFAPEACVRLISIHQLNNDGYVTTFQSNRCKLTDTSGITVADCAPNPSNLYSLPAARPLSDMALPSLVLTPDLETWHRRLGHANHQTVLEMARGGTAKGMPVDLSFAPQACDHCVRGKQARSPVPKVREGARATRRLGRIYIDLSGPHSVMSRSGFRYIMNIIDDYSGYNWTRLLKAKSDAFGAFCTWLTATETQSREKLCYVLTDNGELRSADMARWCADRGVTHQFTAPHTSAQNGRVERLHRTLMDKARTMRLACGAPLHMWDEFIVTASYLTNLTSSRSLEGHTPHELWFSSKPSISHLREIGCRAYVLISGNNPKIAARSLECILIGYTPNSKAYRCWDSHGGRVIDSHHVRFIEHLQASPHTLTPGVIVNPLDDAADADSHDASPPPPSPPSPSDPSPPIIPSHPIVPSPPTVIPPRRSARPHILAPTRQETCDGLEPKKATAAVPVQVALAPVKGEYDIDMPNASAHESEEDSCMIIDVEDPDSPTWGEAITSAEKEKWLEGARSELRSLEDMEVFRLVPRSAVPQDRKILRGKFVCKLKRDEFGNPVRHKVVTSR